LLDAGTTDGDDRRRLLVVSATGCGRRREEAVALVSVRCWLLPKTDAVPAPPSV